MKNKKRLFGALVIIILALTMIATLAACGEEETVQYTVTLKSGFDDQVTTQTLNEGEVFTLPASPFTRDGYTFDYWTEEGTTYPNQVGNPIPVYRNMTFVAHWTENYVPDVPEDFTVTVKDGYGSGQITAVVTEGEEYVLPAADTFTRPEYTFGGWQVGDSVMEAGDSVTITANTEIIAVWHAIPKYNVSVLKGYGDNAPIATYVVTSGGSYTLPEMTLDYADHNFLGYAELSGDLTEYLAAGTVIENITSNKTFVAMWEEITYYTVYLKKTADATGTDVDNSNRVIEGGSFVLPECNFGNDGYDFKAWLYNGEEVQPGFTIENVVSDIDVIAVWELAEEPQPEQYTVTFTNGLYSRAGGTYTEDTGYTIPLDSDTYFPNTDYKLIGWTVADDDSGKVYKPGETYNGNANVVFEAVLEKIVYYTVTLSDGAGKNETVVKVESGTVYEYILPAADKFSREGYTFAGWKIGEETYSAGETVNLTVDKNITITAVWEAIPTYTVTYYYESNGTQISVSSAMYSGTEYDLIDYPADQTPPTGMKFDGWKLVGGDETVYPAGTRITVSGNAGYYAVYRDAVFTVAFYSDNAETASYEIAEGGNAAIPAAPEKTGYTFLGWYLNGEGEALTGEYVYNVTNDMRFEAKWQINSYEITFVYHNGSQTFNVNYGEMPTGPIDSDSYQDDDYIYTFSGTYDPEIVAVTGDCTYTAVYSKTARLYPITFNGGGYVNFLNTDGEVVSSAERKNNQSYFVTIEKCVGVNISEMKILANGVEITAVDGVYEIPFVVETEVIVDGAYFVEYEIEFAYSNVEYIIKEKPEKNIYGATVQLLAIGIDGYADNAPTVSYEGENIESYGTELVDEKEYHVYDIKLVKNGTISIVGNIDTIPVTFVYLNGIRETVNWTAEYGPIGIDCDLLSIDGFTKYVLEETNQICKVAYDYDDNTWQKYYPITDKELDSYIVSKQEAENYVTERINNPIYPQKDKDNVYYIFYYIVEEEETGTVGFVVPVGAYDFAYLIEGDADWNTNVYDKMQSPSGRANYYKLYKNTSSQIEIAFGKTVYFKFNIPGIDDAEGMPVLTNPETGEELRASVQSVNGNEVVCYKFTVKALSQYYECVADTLHTWSHAPIKFDNGEYNIYNLTGNGTGEKVFVEDGGSWEFSINLNLKSTDIMSRLTKQADGTYKIKEDTEFLVFTSDYVPEYTYTIPAIGQYDSIIKMKVKMSNIQDDVSFDVNIDRRSDMFTFVIEEGYTIFIDGVPIVGNPGDKIEEKIYCNSIITLVPNDSELMFIDSGESYIVYYYTEGGAEKTAKNHALEVRDGYGYFAVSAYTFYTPVITEKPFEFHGIALASASVYNDTEKCASSNSNNGITFTTGKPYIVDPEKTFSFTVKLPFGNYPVLYIEYADLLTDGYYTYGFETVSHESDYSIFTFKVTDIPCDITWFIRLQPNEYQITVHYGDETEVVTMKHGDRLSDSDALRKYYVGMNNGVSGMFTVTGWQNEQGATVISIQNGEDLYAVTEFSPAKVVFGNQVYQSLSEALAALPDDAVGNLDIVWSDEPQVLTAGEYVIPAGVTLRLPYANGKYGRKLGELTDNPSMFYANAADGKIMLIINEGATLIVNGGISVGGIVGYPASAKPYQGQTSADHAILQLDGELIIQGGGKLDINGYVVGNGKVELTAGAESYLPFVVKDYRGGTNSSNVYYCGIAPFNIFEMPNIQTRYIIHYGATEYAYAMLYAMDTFNMVYVEAIGEQGIIRVNEGGIVEKHTEKIENPRYSAETASYEPEYEFRTSIDVYGGGTDGAMMLDLGLVGLSTEGVLLGVPYTYSVTLHQGEYILYNKYKIMPGGSLKVAEDATLTLAAESIDNADYMGTIIVYSNSFAEDIEGISYFNNKKQLSYPAEPNGQDEGGHFIVNGKLIIDGAFGGEITSEKNGAIIEVYTANANLNVYSREAVQFNGGTFTVTYEQTSSAYATGSGGKTELKSGYAYTYGSDGSWK